jgi:hypothetical protein
MFASDPSRLDFVRIVFVPNLSLILLIQDIKIFGFLTSVNVLVNDGIDYSQHILVVVYINEALVTSC